MAWRLETQKGYQMPQQYLKTTLPNRPQTALNWGRGQTQIQSTPGDYHNWLNTMSPGAQASALYQNGGQVPQQYLADTKWNNPLRASMASANQETAGNPYNVQYRSYGRPEDALWNGQTYTERPMAAFNIQNGRVLHDRPFGLTTKPNAIPTPYAINDLGQHSQLVRHTNVGGPMGGLMSLAGFGLGLPGGLLAGAIGKLPAGLQTLAKVGGIGSKLYGAVKNKGTNVAGGILGAIPGK